MKRPLWLTIAIAGAFGAVAVPSVVFGNARRNTGTLAAQQLAETPFVGQMTGAKEFPGPGDPNGSGSAAVSFDQLDADSYEVCWDLAYTGIALPIAAHIHPGAAGTAADPVIVFTGTPTADSWSGCVDADASVVDPILANPGNFYVNVHTSEFPGGAIRSQLAKGPAPAGSLHFLPTPLRAYDSRTAGNTPLAAAEVRTVDLSTGTTLEGATTLAVPAGATGAIITLTATQTGGPSYLVVFSNDSPLPPTSNLNWVTAGDTVAVTTQVAVDAHSRIKVGAGPASTHFIVDVVGYLY
jgi:CHRD domain